MNKFVTIITTVCIFGLIINHINAVEFTDCGSKVGKFKSISVSDCDLTKTACVLKKNSNATISIDFEANEPATNVNTVVHGIIMGIEMPFPLSNPDGCKDSGVTCPIDKGTVYKYTATLPVLRSYPKVSVDVKWQLKNENKDDIVCVLIPAKIE